jgi:hypothetical protein
MSKEFFNPTKACPCHESFHHSDVTTLRCEHCEKFNPNLRQRQPSIKPERQHSPALPGPDDDVQSISDGSPPKQLSSAPPRPAPRSAQNMPSLISGIGEKARRESTTTTSKAKTGYNAGPDVFHFLIGVAHYNLTTEKWKKAPTSWMKAEGNRKITSEALLQSLLAKVRIELDRSAYKQWLAPPESGNWLLCHQFTQQGYPVIIEAWNESLLLSEVIDTRPFNARASDGKKDPTIGVWLCFQPDEPSDCTDSVPTPTPTPKEPKKKGKAGTGIKKENKKEIKKEVVDKRPRSAGSAEINRPAKRLPVRQGNAAMQAGAMEQVEEDLLHTGDDVEDDLPPPRATHAT